jgi:hypothetical protein
MRNSMKLYEISKFQIRISIPIRIIILLLPIAVVTAINKQLTV